MSSEISAFSQAPHMAGTTAFACTGVTSGTVPGAADAKSAAGSLIDGPTMRCWRRAEPARQASRSGSARKRCHRCEQHDNQGDRAEGADTGRPAGHTSSVGTELLCREDGRPGPTQPKVGTTPAAAKSSPATKTERLLVGPGRGRAHSSAPVTQTPEQSASTGRRAGFQWQ